MKKFILSLVLIILGLGVSFSQNTYTFNFPKNSSYEWQNSVGSMTEAYCGTSGVFAGISKSDYHNKHGNYEYVIWMSTNSYSSQECKIKYTYMEDVEIFYYDTYNKKWKYPTYFTPLWIHIGSSSPVYTIYSSDPSLYIQIKLGTYKISNM